MTPMQTLALLTAANQVDPRVEVTDTTVDLWHKIVGDLAYDRAEAAVIRHYRESTDRIMPGHVRALAKTTTGPTRAEDWCTRCMGVHAAEEPCNVLTVNPGAWRKALTAGRALGPAIKGVRLPEEAPPPDLDPAAAAAAEAERTRQLAALEAISFVKA